MGTDLLPYLSSISMVCNEKKLGILKAIIFFYITNASEIKDKFQ